jgi:arsenate reductase
MITIYHNPRCSKSRETLERAQQFAAAHAIELTVVDYQKTPLTLAQLAALHRILQSEGKVAVRDMVRDGEEAFALLHLDQADDAALFDALAAHPILLQRPIVTFNARGIIARPPQLADKVLIAP